jgi:signal peptidase I
VTPRVRRRLRFGLRATERFLAGAGLVALIYHGGFDYSVMISGSMAPALQGDNARTGDRVLFEKWTGRFRAPRRWEIYQFHTAEGLTVAKRVVGLPGEHVSLREGALCIDGKPIPVPGRLAYLRYYPFGNLADGREIDCGAGYYALGDDSHDSYDSRYIGVLAPERLTGRAWLILGPGERRGFVR